MNTFFEDHPCILDSSSDEEIEEMIILSQNRLLNIGGSSTSNSNYIRQRISIDRNTIGGHNLLFQDYFADSPTYGARLFRRRFRMRRDLFIQIKNAIEANDSYFAQRRNAAGKLGLSALQKVIASFRMLAYGIAGDFTDEYIRIGETTAIKSMKRFVKSIINIFGSEYLRSPNRNDIARLLAKAEQRGTPGMLGSIDCMHWEWKNCPTQWAGMYSGRRGKPTIILEAIASYDTWIWHAFFGLPGSLNDINVLDRSSVFNLLAQGRATPVNYRVNGRDYNMGYYLADGIYPQWATFVKSIPTPVGVKRQYFSMVHESYRKDVKRAFGVLQARFAIIRGAARYFDKDVLQDIMMACIIMHNMIVEDEHCNTQEGIESCEYEQDINGPPQPIISSSRTEEVRNFIARHLVIRDKSSHKQLQDDLIGTCGIFIVQVKTLHKPRMTC